MPFLNIYIIHVCFRLVGGVCVCVYIYLSILLFQVLWCIVR